MRTRLFKSIILSTSALMSVHGFATAQDIVQDVAQNASTSLPSCTTVESATCQGAPRGAVYDARTARIVGAPPNTAGDILRDPNTPSAFKLSVDGQTVSGRGFDYESDQRATDVALAQTAIQVKFDGLDVNPTLNVGVRDQFGRVDRTRSVVFDARSNYSAFIDRAEIRIFDADNVLNREPIAIVPVINTRARFQPDARTPDSVFYQFRVYDAQGRYDETRAKTLNFGDGDYSLSDEIPSDAAMTEDDAEAAIGDASYGPDDTYRRTIEVKGAVVTVYGQDVPDGYAPTVLDKLIPVGPDGRFVAQEILPFGDQSVTVDVTNASGQGVSFTRDVHIRENDLFYVAIGDVTLGQRDSVRPTSLALADDGEGDDIVVNGRGAFYAKGKVKGDYLVTAALDTGDQPVSDLISNLDQKNPRQLLRRLDADLFYPVYGDDSTTIEDAPTQGRFYVRVEKDDSHIMWGNFATQITGTEFVHLDRGLYGGVLDYDSQALTESGERRTEVTAFAADPGTVPVRDEFRGTGGSLYFLQRQDLTIGSERVRIEVRDKVSGLVLETRNLRPQEDYDVDYLQGRILLSEPLQSTIADDQIVRDNTLSGNDLFLVVRYETTPTFTDIDGLNVGGRATHWLGDHVRIGATAQTDTTATADQDIYGADILLQASEGTYIKAEYARSEGPGFGQSNSADGGFIFDEIPTPGLDGDGAEAYRVEAAVELERISESVRGRLLAYAGHSDEDFSGANRIGKGEIDRFGAALNAELTDKTTVTAKYDDLETSRNGETRALYLDVVHAFDRRWSLGAGLRYDERDTTDVVGISPNRLDIVGTRTDISAEVTYSPDEDWYVAAFAQGTVDKSAGRRDNDRVGLSGEIALSERFDVAGEVSVGEGGLGAQAKATFARDEDTQLYIGYALLADRSDTAFSPNRIRADRGTLTAGARTRFNDALSVYGEEQFAYGSRSVELSHVYGVDFTPNEAWSFGATIENGTIEDDIDGDFDRTAFSLSAGRAVDGLRFGSNLEGRFETGVLAGQVRDRTTWLSRNTLAYDVNRDWELLARGNFAISDSDESSFLDSDYVEGILAAAYRPVENDRLNALMKYTYFENLAPAQQETATGQRELARQRSQVFSVDGTYDLTPRLSLGGKYGVRRGEVALDRTVDEFVDSDAQLGIVRADYHVVSRWDLLVEGRVLSSSLADDRRLGALIGAYRHVGDRFKVGVGYSFSEFSDDLTDFDNDSDGAFVNLIGKF